MALSFKLTDKKMYRVWGVFSEDTFVCKDNLSIIKNICSADGIDDDSISYFELGKFDWDDLKEIIETPSFFGERLVVVEAKDIVRAVDDDIAHLTDLCKSIQFNHLRLICPYSDVKKIKNKKFAPLLDAVKQNGLLHFIDVIDEKYLVQMIIERAEASGAKISKQVAEKIVMNTGKDVGLIQNEVDKYCAAANYGEITAETVDLIGIKTVEASVFDMIGLICSDRQSKAVEKLNSLFEMKTDETAIIGALESSFVDINRCKNARNKKINYQTVNKDIDNRPNPYKYQKAMGYSQKFSQTNLEKILKLLLDTDIKIKSSAIDKKQIVYVTVAQIMSLVNK